jgi:hypothetical protein
MTHTSLPSRFWITWLLCVSVGVIVFGLLLVIAPALSRQGFSLLMFASTTHIENFGAPAANYIALAHVVIGAVMIGWGSALFGLSYKMLANGSRLAWNLITLSVLAWFVPDTSYSLLSGFWQNAVLNTVFLLLFAFPLLAIRSQTRSLVDDDKR